MHSLGKWIIVAGILITIIGLIIFFFGNKLNWIGHLPGDIKLERKHFKIYFPITTMVLASILITIIINLIKKLF
ncbi:DUF2905 domain-containing protein [Marinilabiliaceae bacterium JC017]|nr:DUF2905 domain-containing protein [Marinilabiliaceae bacterium JC017]